MNCKKNSSYCDGHGKPYSSGILALMRDTKRDTCFMCTSSNESALPADYTLPTFETAVFDGSKYTTVGYQVHVDLRQMDWRHIIANAAGIAGDAATIAALLDPLPVVDEVAVGGIAVATNAVGIVVDAYDVLAENDFSGSLTDTAFYVAQKTNAVKRLVPIAGLGVHVSGLVQAAIPGIHQIPIIAPIPPPTIQ